MFAVSASGLRMFRRLREAAGHRYDVSGRMYVPPTHRQRGLWVGECGGYGILALVGAFLCAQLSYLHVCLIGEKLE